MQYDFKELEKKYGKKSDMECQKLMIEMHDQMVERGEEFIGFLWYFEKSKRYRRIPGFEKHSFQVYVWEVCHLPYNRYRELAYAYNWFPVESRELGPTVIQTIRSKVGVVKIPKVLGEIKKTLSDIKDPNKKREAMYEIINKHTPAQVTTKNVNQGEDTKAYWRKKYEDEHALRLKEKKAFEDEIVKLEAQLEKQKAPVRAFLAMKEAVMPVMQQAKQ